jgi:hypothetical protein
MYFYLTKISVAKATCYSAGDDYVCTVQKWDDANKESPKYVVQTGSIVYFSTKTPNRDLFAS